MKRICRILSVVVAAMCFSITVCSAGEEKASLDDVYFSDESVHLTAKERNALAIAKRWQQGEIMGENPVVGQDGSIEYLFGAEQPNIVCAVMQITDIPSTGL